MLGVVRYTQNHMDSNDDMAYSQSHTRLDQFLRMQKQNDEGILERTSQESRTYPACLGYWTLYCIHRSLSMYVHQPRRRQWVLQPRRRRHRHWWLRRRRRQWRRARLPRQHGEGGLAAEGQIMLSRTSHLSMPFLHLSLSRQCNTWLQKRVRTASWASRVQAVLAHGTVVAQRPPQGRRHAAESPDPEPPPASR